MVTLTVVVIAQPPLLVYVMVLVPRDIALTSPLDDTVATPVLLDVQGVETAGIPDPVS